MHDLPAGLLDLGAPVVFMPVRHHSPGCARVTRGLIRRLRPAAVLIEGPSDYNSRFTELHLDHQLPIAIYSYFRSEDGRRRGAYYPFCVYSPEWQAIRTAHELGIPTWFMDAPWYALDGAELPAHRYSDGDLRASDYVRALCRELGVEDFDAAWDLLFECDPDPHSADWFRRCHELCFRTRTIDAMQLPADLLRERFMAAEIRRAREKFDGQILVVSGGFHSSALHQRLQEPPDDPDLGEAPEEHGIALTPYSYARLDSLTGYESGMPNPGFYHEVWQDHEQGRKQTYRRLLAQAARALRRKGQLAGTADLIAVETTARSLAALRGRAEVWRLDLVDGILGALVKEEVGQGVRHPFLEVIYEVFRGTERGRVADGAELPPLVRDIRRTLTEHELQPEQAPRAVVLELTEHSARAKSRILHCLLGLGIAGFERTGGTDFAVRDDLVQPHESWRVQWAPEFDAHCIEAALYGPTLGEAAAARLLERVEQLERDAAGAALLLVAAAQMGLDDLAPELLTAVTARLREDAAFESVAGAIGHLLYLYRYDETLGTLRGQKLGTVLREAWTRGLWLLDMAGDTGDARAQGVRILVESLDRAGADLDLNREDLVTVLRRVSTDVERAPALRGVAAGALWTLGETDVPALVEGLRGLPEPTHLGDYLAGLFSIAREAAQRYPALLLALNKHLMEFDEDAFLEALPALRLAFSYFAPREKHHLAGTLFRTLGYDAAASLPPLSVTADVAARAMHLENRVFRLIERFGLGAPP